MRLRTTQNNLTINAVVGTSAILLSFDLPEEKVDGLLGFYIHKQNLTTNTHYDVESTRFFADTVPHPEQGAKYNTKEHPWQSFLWEDFYVEFGAEYVYTIKPVYGTPRDLQYGRSAKLQVTVPTPKDDAHEVYFNRGVAGSQAYATRFGNERPDEMIPSRRKEALQWLSKGLDKVLISFIRKAKSEEYQLRCCFYEFEYEGVLDALKEAAAGGADVKVIYDSRKQGDKNDEAVARAKFPRKLLIRRASDPGYLQHNKFMVLLKNKNPVAVWTGSTNITEKGIYGQCNVGHIVKDRSVAKKYFDYWMCLKKDPENAAARIGCLNLQADVDDFEEGTTAFFSPRSKRALLNTYTTLIEKSQQLVCGMFPFSFNKAIKAAIIAETDFLKYIIINRKDKNTTLQTNDYDNVIVYGGQLETPIYQWLAEKNAGQLFYPGVNFIHNKVMLIDPLGERPVVITGSANFSDNSILRNDENTLVIKGNTHVADLYFTEFARIFNHYSSRQDIKKLSAANKNKNRNPNHLEPKSSKWVSSFYLADKLKFKRKQMFNNMAAEEV